MSSFLILKTNPANKFTIDKVHVWERYIEIYRINNNWGTTTVNLNTHKRNI